ncbi:MAG TPA: hypothetical protein VEK57_30330 [Thermoanaerobaculia bacterium]|nr:hypothetical protein [Thermoanaerobaculia bacterium]
MKYATILSLTLTLTLAGACGQQERTATNDAAPATSVAASTPATALTPEQLGELGALIRKEPGRADELLGRHHLTRQQFEQAIRDVTENADASKRYAEAYRKASA